MKTKIQLNDSMQEILFKMSEGNPGALTLCLTILEKGHEIDPDCAMGGLGAILGMDSLGLYAHKIWMLYKDVCGCNLPVMLAVLRGHQLGLVSEQDLLNAVSNHGAGINLDEICAKVAERLPKFQFNQPALTPNERK